MGFSVRQRDTSIDKYIPVREYNIISPVMSFCNVVGYELFNAFIK